MPGHLSNHERIAKAQHILTEAQADPKSHAAAIDQAIRLLAGARRPGEVGVMQAAISSGMKLKDYFAEVEAGRRPPRRQTSPTKKLRRKTLQTAHDQDVEAMIDQARSDRIDWHFGARI